jgi:ribonuclease HI
MLSTRMRKAVRRYLRLNPACTEPASEILRKLNVLLNSGNGRPVQVQTPEVSPLTVEEAEKLASQLGISDFDLLLIGDGSGTIHNNPCGWACVAYDRNRKQITFHNGASSSGTNNYAELAPYIHALWHYHYDKTNRKNETKVAIVSDSEVTVKCGNGEYTRSSNKILWASVLYLEEQEGYKIFWKHVHRNTNIFSKKCDWFAGRSRQSLDELRKELLNQNDG